MWNVKRIFKLQRRKETEFRFYKLKAVPSVLCGNKIWGNKQILLKFLHWK